MAVIPEWQTPANEPVVLLVEARTAVERELVELYERRARDAGTAVSEVRTVEANSSDEPASMPVLRAALGDERDPWLMPVRVAWLPPVRNGERTVRLRDVLVNVGDPRHPNVARQRRLLRTAPDRCHLVVGQPARVSDVRRRWASISGQTTADEGSRIDSGGKGGNFASFVLRQSTLALERAETNLVGAQYKVPRLVREELLATARFRTALGQLARDLGRSEEEVTAEATSYLHEMVTGWSRLLVDLQVRIGRYNFRRSYDPQLDYDPDQVSRLREIARSHPVVFLPSHKSNLDTLVMTVALHENGLPRTHVFGGINMAFWPVGPLFQRAGLIYIRRSIKDNPVYRFTLRNYIGYLLEKRFSLQFYMEGTRSRTGKLAPPRLGLLRYVVDAYREGHSEDVVLVPVSIAYDQLHEVRDFAREAHGAGKSAESIGWLLRAFREQAGRYGRIYVRFAEPLSLRSMLGPPEGSSRRADDDRGAVQKIALEVSRRISEATPITATALLTLSLLGAQGRALTLEQVRATVHDPLHYAMDRGLPLAHAMDLHSVAGLQSALAELERHHVIMRFTDGPEPVYVIGPDQHLTAAFYRNSVIHYFLHGALAELALARSSGNDVTDPVAVFWTTVLQLRDLLKFDFFFEPREEFQAAIARELAWRDPDWESRLAAGPDSIRSLLTSIRPLMGHTLLRSFLEAYAVLAAALVRHDADRLDERELLAACLALGRQYLLQKRVTSPESLAKPLFASGYKLAVSRGLIGDDQDERAQRQFLDELRTALKDVDTVTFYASKRVVELINSESSSSAEKKPPRARPWR
jgi:glycerol-3-phosphate O-acyltransferase